MASERGVTCHQCGASTPLPDDLRVPTFQCAFCKTVLQTASYAGHSAVSADALLGHLQAAVASPATAMDAARSAPRFEGGDTSSRPAACLRCGAEVQVPLALHVHQLTCGACHAVQPVTDYLSDKVRLELDMARQVAGNEALKRLQAEGVPCTKCGGRNPVPEDGSIQLVCKFCSATILLSDHVDASAVARQRLKHGVFGLRDELMRKQKEQDRIRNVLIPAGIVISILILAALGAIFGR